MSIDLVSPLKQEGDLKVEEMHGSGFISDDKAAQILLTENSGLQPDLSKPVYRRIKRLCDVVFSSLALIILAIPFGVIAAVIYIKSPGASPFYSQLRVGRVGKDGRYTLFRMYKFRSMIPNADQYLHQLADKNEADGPLFKIKEDPRIIPGIGKYIRKHSVDELPQLLNVLKGDMTLIGPRPGLPKEVLEYSAHDRERLTVIPGCGGLWQATTRSDSTFNGMIESDLWRIQESWAF